MDNLRQGEGVSIGELFHMIGKKIWYVLGITLLLTVICVILVEFAVNPRTQTYSWEFAIKYPASETLKYPDGTPLNYRDMVSYDALKEAKESDARFVDVDIDGMVAADDISIVETTIEENDEVKLTGKYRITVKGSYFSDTVLATEFIRAVANVPIERINLLANMDDYTLSKSVLDNAKLYSSKIELLSTQKKRLIAEYDEWISMYRDSYAVNILNEDGTVKQTRTIRSYKEELESIFNESEQEKLLNEVELNGYVPADQRAAELAQLNKEKALNLTKLQAYYEALNSVDPSLTASATEIWTEIALLTGRNVEIDEALSNLAKTAEADVFEQKIIAYYNDLQKCANDLKYVMSNIYNQESAIVYSTAKALVAGEMNFILVAVLSFAVIFVLSSVVVIALDYREKNKQQKETISE